ncbi:MAG TPA: hypothetical protein PLQ78_03555 [Flavipsychrobacter sp.]|nr:hypothetical protein [Flavipsychrobacter sp.]
MTIFGDKNSSIALLQTNGAIATTASSGCISWDTSSFYHQE